MKCTKTGEIVTIASDGFFELTRCLAQFVELVQQLDQQVCLGSSTLPRLHQKHGESTTIGSGPMEP